MDASSVLVLNFGYRPIALVNWQDAFTMLFSKRAEVVQYYDDKMVQSANETWFVPSVIRFLKKASAKFFKKSIRFTRKNVWLRDYGKCQYCACSVKVSDFTYDHVVPVSKGGKTTWENIVVACVACNQKKQDRTPNQAKMTLRSQPTKPRSLPKQSDAAGLSWKDQMPSDWRSYFVSQGYWNSVLDD